jgi:hypothetical protein
LRIGEFGLHLGLLHLSAKRQARAPLLQPLEKQPAGIGAAAAIPEKPNPATSRAAATPEMIRFMGHLLESTAPIKSTEPNWRGEQPVARYESIIHLAPWCKVKRKM